MQTSERRVARAARLAIYINLLLVAGKVAVGVFTGSVSVLSEAAHSGVDLLLAAAVWLAVRFAHRPADDTHPYGHGKVESLASLGAGVAILGVAGLLAWEGVNALVRGAEAVQVGPGIAVMAVAALTSGLLSRYLLRVSRAENSPALEATGLEMGTDTFTACGVVVGLILTRLTGWATLDPLIGLAVAAIVLWNGCRVLVRAVRGLIDAQLPPDELAAIREVLDAHADNYLEYHALRTRHVGGAHAIDLHLVVPRTMSVGEAHALSSHLEDEIAAALPQTDVTIHMEPDTEAEGRRQRVAS